MLKEDLAFVNAYKQAVDLSPESLPFHEPSPDFGISLTDFNEKLHIQGETCEKLVEELLTSTDNIIFLVGPRGSGKTTTGLKTFFDLEKAKFFTHWIRISEHEANQYLDDRREMIAFLRGYISRYMKHYLSEPQEEGVDPLSKLTAYFLCQDLSELERPLKFNTDFFEAQHELRNLMQTQRIEFRVALQYLTVHNSVPKILDIQTDLLKKAEIHHLSSAIKYFFKKTGIVVWIDNVDAFEQEAQTELINAIFSIWKSDQQNLRFVVAAREENVLRFDHFYEVQGSVRKSAVYINDDKKGANSGMIMPNLKAEKFREILSSRFDFARDFQKYIETKGREMSPEAEEHEKRQMQAKEEKYLPIIAKLRKDYLEILSEKARKAIEGEKILHLFNNNIRLLLPLHHDFLKYLVGLGYDNGGIPYAYYYDDSFVRTLLLFWLSTIKGEAANEFRHFNVVQFTRDTLHKGKKSEEITKIAGCFLPFLALSCLWNLCLRNRSLSGETFNLPTLGELIDKIGTLELCSRDDIQKTILNLYGPNEALTMFLAIETKKRITDISQLDNRLHVRITYKGRAALASLCNSFGFLYAMQFVCDRRHLRGEVLNPRKLGNYFKDLLPDLKKIGELHLMSLIEIRDKTPYGNSPNWLERYLDDFGIPLEPEFSRTQRASRTFGKSPRRVLYFDSLIHSIESYAREARTPALGRTMRSLIEQYRQLLSKIEKREPLDPDDIVFNI